MSYRNISRDKEKESTVEEINQKVENGQGSKGVIKYFKEDEPVNDTRSEFWIEYKPYAEKPFRVRVNKRERDDVYLEFEKKGNAEDTLTGILKDVTEATDYKLKTANGLHFKMVKAGLGQEEEVVEETTIGLNSRNRSDKMDKYFASDEEYVMERIRKNGYYGEAVGQGLRSHVEIV